MNKRYRWNKMISTTKKPKIRIRMNKLKIDLSRIIKLIHMIRGQ